MSEGISRNLLSVKNETSEVIEILFEPWASQASILPGQLLEVIYASSRVVFDLPKIELKVVNDGWIVEIDSWASGEVKVFLNEIYLPHIIY